MLQRKLSFPLGRFVVCCPTLVPGLALLARQPDEKHTKAIKHYEMVCVSIEAKYRFIEQHHYHIPNFIAHAEKRIWCLICLSINERWIKRKIFVITVITMAITIIIIYGCVRYAYVCIGLFVRPCPQLYCSCMRVTATTDTIKIKYQWARIRKWNRNNR